MDSTLLGQVIAHRGVALARCLQTEQEGKLPAGLVEHVENQRFQPAESEIKDERFIQSLNHFIAKKADLLFRGVDEEVKDIPNKHKFEDNYAIMPALESFMGIPAHICKDHFFNGLEKREVVIGVVTSVLESGLLVSLLCLDSGRARDIDDLKMIVFCPVKEVPKIVPDQSVLESFHVKDIVRGIVLNVNPETQRIIISLHEKSLNPEDPNNPKLGLISEDDFPVHYRRKLHVRGLTFDELLQSIMGFNNSGNVEYLVKLHNLKDCSLMRGIHNLKLPEKEYAENLRKWQCQRLALQSVAQGVSLFKKGRQMEAMQHLNKALQIDESNVEALVARGALYANNESFTRAVEDFEQALKINPIHANARKYLLETKLAHGKLFEDEKDYVSSLECYRQAVALDPTSDEALTFLRSLEHRMVTTGVSPQRGRSQGRSRDNRDELSEECRELSGRRRREESPRRHKDYSPRRQRDRSPRSRHDESVFEKTTDKLRRLIEEEQENRRDERKRKYKPRNESPPKSKLRCDREEREDDSQRQWGYSHVADNPYASIFNRDVSIPCLGSPEAQSKEPRHSLESSVFPEGFCNPQDPNFVPKVRKPREEFAGGRMIVPTDSERQQSWGELKLRRMSHGDSSPSELDQSHSPKSTKSSKSPFDEEAFLYGASEIDSLQRKSQRSLKGRRSDDWEEREMERRGDERRSRNYYFEDMELKTHSSVSPEWEQVKMGKVVRLESPNYKKGKGKGKARRSRSSSSESSSGSSSRSSSRSSSSSSSSFEDKPKGDYYEKRGVSIPKGIRTDGSFMEKDYHRSYADGKEKKEKGSDSSARKHAKSAKYSDEKDKLSKPKNQGRHDSKGEGKAGRDKRGSRIERSSSKKKAAVETKKMPDQGNEDGKSKKVTASVEPSTLKERSMQGSGNERRSTSNERWTQGSKRSKSVEKVLQDSSVSSLSEKLEKAQGEDLPVTIGGFGKIDELPRGVSKDEELLQSHLSSRSLFHVASKWDDSPPVDIKIKPDRGKYENIQISITTGGKSATPNDPSGIHIFSGKQLSKYRADKHVEENESDDDELERLFLKEKGLQKVLKGKKEGAKDKMQEAPQKSDFRSFEEEKFSRHDSEGNSERIDCKGRQDVPKERSRSQRKDNAVSSKGKRKSSTGKGNYDEDGHSDNYSNDNSFDEYKTDSYHDERDKRDSYHHDEYRHHSHDDYEDDHHRDRDKWRDRYDDDRQSRYDDDHHRKDYSLEKRRGNERNRGKKLYDDDSYDYTRQDCRPRRGRNRQCDRYCRKNHCEGTSTRSRDRSRSRSPPRRRSRSYTSSSTSSSSSSSSSSRSRSREKSPPRKPLPKATRQPSPKQTLKKEEPSQKINTMATKPAIPSTVVAAPIATDAAVPVIEADAEAMTEEKRRSLRELESFLTDLKDRKKQQWIAEGKVKTTV